MFAHMWTYTVMKAVREPQAMQLYLSTAEVLSVPMGVGAEKWQSLIN